MSSTLNPGSNFFQLVVVTTFSVHFFVLSALHREATYAFLVRKTMSFTKTVKIVQWLYNKDKLKLGIACCDIEKVYMDYPVNLHNSNTHITEGTVLKSYKKI